MTAVYMVAIASDQFISEAHFIVRSANRQTASGLGALLQGTGLSSIRDESYPVTDFLKSRDALRDVSNSVGFRNMVGRTGADFLARFPAFYQDDTFEELFEHYSRIVTVIHDTTTGINTLKVRTFTPEDSRRLAEALLDASERVVNRLNERALGDSVALAAREVQNAEARSAAAQKALTEYRILSGVVDTSSTAKGFLELIGGLEKELAQSRAQLGQTQASSPNSPGAQSIRDRIGALEQQVATERKKLIGADGALVGTVRGVQPADTRKRVCREGAPRGEHHAETAAWRLCESSSISIGSSSRTPPTCRAIRGASSRSSPFSAVRSSSTPSSGSWSQTPASTRADRRAHPNTITGELPPSVRSRSFSSCAIRRGSRAR
jgi:BexC/CtrB/KpsE family polysaccharide export inner-membrane protein